MNGRVSIHSTLYSTVENCATKCCSVYTVLGLSLFCYILFLPRCIYAGRSFRSQRCPSVCLSDTRVNCDKTNESSAEILIPYERKIKIHVVPRTHRMVGGGRPLLPEILGQTDPPSFKNGNFHSIFARSGSTVGASEKCSIMTNRSSVRAFQ